MEKICIGVVLKGFGIRGEVKVKPLTDFIKERFKVGAKIYVNATLIKILSVRMHQGMLLVRFEGYDDLTKAETLRNAELFVDKAELHKLGKNEYYFFDLKGCAVYASTGEALGTVSVVEDYPAQVVLRIAHKPKDILIPFIAPFITDVDIEAKKIIVEVMDGLL